MRITEDYHIKAIAKASLNGYFKGLEEGKKRKKRVYKRVCQV